MYDDWDVDVPEKASDGTPSLAASQAAPLRHGCRQFELVLVQNIGGRSHSTRDEDGRPEIRCRGNER